MDCCAPQPDSWTAGGGTSTDSACRTSYQPPPSSLEKGSRPAAYTTCSKAHPVPTLPGTRGRGLPPRPTSGSGAPLWASSNGPDGGPPSKPVTTCATRRHGHSRKHCASPSVHDSQGPRHGTLTMALSARETCGHEKCGRLPQLGRRAERPRRRTWSATHAHDLRSATKDPRPGGRMQAVPEASMLDAGTSPHLASDVKPAAESSTTHGCEVVPSDDHSTPGPGEHQTPPPHAAVAPPDPQPDVDRRLFCTP